MATTSHTSAAQKLGKLGAQSRWKNYSASDRAQLQKMIRQGKAKRAQDGKLPQNDNFAIANELFRLANKLAKRKRGQ